MYAPHIKILHDLSCLLSIFIKTKEHRSSKKKIKIKTDQFSHCCVISSNGFKPREMLVPSARPVEERTCYSLIQQTVIKYLLTADATYYANVTKIKGHLLLFQ